MGSVPECNRGGRLTGAAADRRNVPMTKRLQLNLRPPSRKYALQAAAGNPVDAAARCMGDLQPAAATPRASPVHGLHWMSLRGLEVLETAMGA